MNQHILNGWKEVAHYLKVGVRTAQRWESEFGLPVRRPYGATRSSVMANSHELDLWLQSRPVGDFYSADDKARQNDLLLRARELRSAVSVSRLELAKARENLRITITRLHAEVISAPPPFLRSFFAQMRTEP